MKVTNPVVPRRRRLGAFDGRLLSERGGPGRGFSAQQGKES